MTQDLTTAGPSRRSVAKGAAWAVPAVSVAAAAPTLAASSEGCDPGTLVVTVTCPPLITLPTRDAQQLTFTIANPAGSGCTMPADTVFTVDRGGLAGVQVGPLNDLNVGVDVIFDSATTGRLTAPLMPGDSVTFEVFPRNLVNLAVGESVAVSIAGSSATRQYTIIGTRLPIVGPISVALCG